MPEDPHHFRQARRQPVSLPVRFRKDEPGATLLHEGRMSDVGMGGAFIATDARLVDGQRIILVISAPTAWDPIEVPATVRWSAGGGSEEGGFGVRFDSLSGKEATALYGLVQASAYSESDVE